MAEQYSFFNSKDHDRVYNARHWADYFFPLFKTGVFNGDLQVVATGGMKVKIKKGYAWIDGYVYHLTEDMELELETASGNMNRSDIIVARLDLTNRYIRSFVVTGTYYSATTTPPAPTVTSTVHEIQLAEINVPTGTTEITQELIKDTRANEQLCGWVMGAVQQITLEQLTAQFDAFFEAYEQRIITEHEAYNEQIASLETQAQTAFAQMLEQFQSYENAEKTQFEAWVETIKDILSEEVAGKLLLLIEDCMLKAQEKTSEDGEAYLDIENNLNLVLAGFTAKDTEFVSKNLIRETDLIGNVKTTEFRSKKEIVEEYLFQTGDRYTKTTIFIKNEDGHEVAKERIEKHE